MFVDLFFIGHAFHLQVMVFLTFYSSSQLYQTSLEVLNARGLLPLPGSHDAPSPQDPHYCLSVVLPLLVPAAVTDKDGGIAHCGLMPVSLYNHSELENSHQPPDRYLMHNAF